MRESEYIIFVRSRTKKWGMSLQFLGQVYGSVSQFLYVIVLVCKFSCSDYVQEERSCIHDLFLLITLINLLLVLRRPRDYLYLVLVMMVISNAYIKASFHTCVSTWVLTVHTLVLVTFICGCKIRDPDRKPNMSLFDELF